MSIFSRFNKLFKPDSPSDPARDNSAAPASAPRTSALRVSGAELIRLRLEARDFTLTQIKAASAQTTGAHFTRLRGRGMDYLESRGYQPGDDIRSMDWRVTARSGVAHTKIYHEERERPVVALIDLSPGMFFATRGALKSVIAARSAALIGWSAVLHGDRIGALLFSPERHVEIPLTAGNRGALRLVRELAAIDPDQVNLKAPLGMSETKPSVETEANTFNSAMLRLRRVAHPGSLVFILSDFYNLDQESIHRLQQLRRHCDILAYQILDPLELSPPPAGRYAITNGTEQTVLDTRSAAQRNFYQDYFNSQHRKIETSLRQLEIPLLRLLTTDDIVAKLRTNLNDSKRKPVTGMEVAA